MNPEDLKKLIPDADRIKENLEKNLKKNSLSVSSKNGLVTVVVNFQQEITDMVIDNRLLDPGKAGALKSSLVEAINAAMRTSRSRMFEETARAMNLFK